MSDFQERINNLSVKQKTLLAKQIRLGNTTPTNNVADKPQQRLVAYVTADKSIDKDSLRTVLKDKLPDYMIPSNFVQLNEFPKLPNGKIDVNSLVLPNETLSVSETRNAIPETENEKKLVKIWEDTLNFTPIGIHDNFFEIGGDSILSIQIIAKARKQGITLAPNQLFEHQTISELALFVKSKTEPKDDEIVTGNVPMLPIQHWFFEEHKNAPHHWNQAILFDSPENFDPEIAEKSIDYLTFYHDALRLNFVEENGMWNASIAPPEKHTAFTKADFTKLASSETASQITQKSNELQSNLKLSDSSLFHAVFFDTAKETANKFLLFAHHLLIDNISWGILIEDLQTIYSQLSKNEPISLESKTVSYKKWGKHLASLSESGHFNNELEFWQTAVSNSKKLPADFEATLPVNEESIRTIDLEIDSVTTANLLKNSQDAYNTKTEELLITALMLAINKSLDMNSLCLGLEKHGRRLTKSNLDLSSTVGWFTTYFPVALNVSDVSDLGKNIISIKEQLRNVPNDGIGYGVLRYLQKHSDLKQKPQIIFNYLETLNPFECPSLGTGHFYNQEIRTPKSEHYHLLEIKVLINNGQLNINFVYSEKLHLTSTIKHLSEHFESQLRKLIKHCSSQETIEYSPADFPEANINHNDLASLLKKIG